MPNVIQVPTMGLPVTFKGIANDEFHAWMDEVTRCLNELSAINPPQTGTGTPEGNVTASPGTWYVDTAAAVGTGIYFKETGTGKTGWVQRS